MSTTTSLKLPDDIKLLAAAAAKNRGVTAHAFMVDAIRLAVAAAEQRAEFIAAATTARSQAVTSGKGYAAAEVHSFLRLRAQGKKAARPRAKPWRS